MNSTPRINAIAGYKVGRHELQRADGSGTCSVVVENGPKIIEPANGDCSTYRKLVEDRLGPEQSVFFWGWLRHAYIQLSKWPTLALGQAVILAGPPSAGKSFIQNCLITPVLGGRSIKFSDWTLRTTHSHSILTAEHLLLDDIETIVPADRFSFSEWVKRVVTLRVVATNFRNLDRCLVVPFHRLTIFVNSDRDLWLWKQVERDKVLIFAVQPAADPEIIESELPALIWWLLNEFKLPKELKDERFGLRPLNSPDIANIFNRAEDNDAK